MAGVSDDNICVGVESSRCVDKKKNSDREAKVRAAL